MKHIHLDSCESTQKYLIEMIKENQIDDQQILVSCNTQTAGIGQKQNTWDSYENTLCLSGTIKENDILTLTPLEIGILICEYFNTNFDTKLMLKWPNDILNHNGEKVGGVIINKSGNSPLILGIGLNLKSSQTEQIKDYDYKAGFIFEGDTRDISKMDMAKELYSIFSNNRLSSIQTIHKWNLLCTHLNKEVSVKDNSKEYSGLFIGIGENGQALIKDEGQTHELYSGTLII
jgi:BirA family biotin operon repressor/biotin-[acetyl-CoA-carboxylase] ligase